MEAEAESRREALLLQYFHILWRRWVVIAVFAGALVISATVVSLLMTRYYAATATLVISPKAPTVLDVQEVSQTVDVSTPDERRAYYATQYSIMLSRTVLEEAIRRLREEHGVTDFDEDDDPIDTLRDMLTIDPDASSFLVNVHIEHPDPQMAALFANTVARAYIDLNLDRSVQASKSALVWLSNAQDSYRKTKQSSAEALYQFRVDNDLVGADERRAAIFLNLDHLEEAWSAVNVERVQDQAAYDRVQSLLSADDWLGLANYLSTKDVVLQDRLRKFRDLQQTTAALQAKYLPHHPALMESQAELTSMERQIRQQAAEIVSGKRAELQVVIDREVALRAEIDSAKVVVKELDRKLLEYDNLKAEADKDDEFFRTVDQRKSEVDLEKIIEANNVQFVDEAIPNLEPIRPLLSRNVPVALFIGLMGGIALAFFMEYIDRTIKGPEDVERLLGVPALGPVPMLNMADLEGLTELDRNVFVFARPKSQMAERLRDVRTNILFRTPDHRQRRLLITSALPMEGKSFLSGNLCAIIAMSGHRVLLIDADLRRPTQHKVFQMDNGIGLSSVLIGQCTLDEAIQKTHVPNLDVVLGGPQLPSSIVSPAELFDSDNMRQLIHNIPGYDVVVIDSSPIGAVSDPLILSRLVDGVLMVVFANQTPREIVQQAAIRLREMHATILGAVVNKFDYRRSGYGYGYGYYYQNYGYGYYGEDREAERKVGAK